MKVIISHDVDHITAWEHSTDMIIPKFIVRALIEWGLGRISAYEVESRFMSLITNKWNRIEELMAFDRRHGIPSVFFVGVSNGKYLSYSRNIAAAWIKRIRENGFDVGVHGIAYHEIRAMRQEYSAFQEMNDIDDFGIRLHYLRMNPNTIRYLADIGYAFDSSEASMKQPYQIGTMWEFPLHVMDGHILCNGARWQKHNLEKAQRATKVLIEKALETGISHLSVLFHDRYFSDGFKTWRDWYVWFVAYCQELEIDFINYRNAIDDLEHGRV